VAPDDARLALSNVIEFLDGFLVDVCRFDQDRIETLLVSTAMIDTQLMGEGPGVGLGIMYDTGLIKLVRRAKLSLRFIDFDAWARGWVDSLLVGE
jgi:hypothetical protein